MDDTISRQAAIEALFELYEYQRDIDPTEAADLVRQGIYLAEKKIEQLPSVQPDLAQLLAYECGKASAQPEPLSDAYMKAVHIWLIDYQIKAAELQGRYTPYEVLSWVANDWRKEHEGSD